MAALRALWAEKLIFSLKTLQCWIDLTPKLMISLNLLAVFRQASSPHHQIGFGFVSDGETSVATPLERM